MDEKFMIEDLFLWKVHSQTVSPSEHVFENSVHRREERERELFRKGLSLMVTYKYFPFSIFIFGRRLIINDNLLTWNIPYI